MFFGISQPLLHIVDCDILDSLTHSLCHILVMQPYLIHGHLVHVNLVCVPGQSQNPGQNELYSRFGKLFFISAKLLINGL